MKVIIVTVLLFTVGLSYSQTYELDSLKRLLDKEVQGSKNYVDLLNELSFQSLGTDVSEAMKPMNLALQIADSLDYHKGAIDASLNKGNAYWTIGLYDQALIWYLKCLEYKSNGHEINGMAIYNNIAEVYKKKRMYDSSLVYFNKSWALLEENGSGQSSALLAYNLGELFLSMKLPDSASYYFQKSLNLALKGNDERNLSYAWFGLGELSHTKGFKHEAIDYHERSLRIREKIEDQRAIIQSLLKLAQYHHENKEVQRSMKLLDRAESLAQSIPAYDLLYSTYFQKSVQYSSLNDHKSANTYLVKYHNLKDSLEAKVFALRFQRIQESVVADKEIVENQLEVEQKRYQEQSLEFQVWIIVLIVVLILLVLVFYFNHYKNLTFARNQTMALNDLNEVVISKNKEIESINRALDSKLASTTKMLAESQRISKLGSWEYEIDTKQVRWTDETYKQLELPPFQVEPTYDLLKEFMSVKDFKKLIGALDKTVTTMSPQSIDIITQLKSKNRKHIRVQFFPDIENGKLTRIYGSNQDITEQVIIENQEKSIIQSLLDLSKYANLKHFDFENFIEYLLRLTTDTLEVERAIFWFYHQDEGALHCFKGYDASEDRIENVPSTYVSKNEKYFQAVLENRTLAVEMVWTDKRTQGLDKEYLRKHNVRSILDAKVQVDGEIIGVFSFEKCFETRSWSFSDQRFVGSLTDIIANAFSTYQNKKLENEKEELIEKLLKKSQNLEELAYVISHNLRGPATQITGLSELYVDPKSEDIREEIVQRISESSIELDKVIRDLSLVLKHQQTEEQSTEEIDIKFILQETIERIKSKDYSAPYNLKVSFADDFVLYAKPAIFYNIVFSIFSNAFKYRDTEKLLEINVSAFRKDNKVILNFSDNGIGIDLERYESKIFKMYQRFHLHVKGAGIGLFIVKNQIEVLGGSIEVSSQPGVGTTFSIELPNNVLKEKHRVLIAT